MVVAAVLVVTASCGSDDVEPTAGPTVQPEVGGDLFDWVSVDLDVQMETAVALGEGFVGATVEVKPGADETTQMPFLFTVVTSADGVTWTDADVDVLGPDEGVFWESGGPFGAVGTVMAASSESPVPDLLYTPDGETWMRGQLPDDVLDKAAMGFGPGSYAAGEAGVMVAATMDGGAGTTTVVLLTEDLQTWQGVEHPLPASGDMGLEVTANTDGEYLLSAPVGGGPGPVPIVGAVSSDGQTWEVVTSTEEYQIAGGGNDWSTGWRDGFAVAAQVVSDDASGPEEGMGQTQIWLLTDDRTWSEVNPAAVPASHLVPGDYHGSSLGLLVVGENLSQPDTESAQGTTSLLLTSDGQTWQDISTDVPIGGGPPMPLVLGETSVLVGVRGPNVPAPAEMQLWVGSPRRGYDET